MHNLILLTWRIVLDAFILRGRYEEKYVMILMLFDTFQAQGNSVTTFDPGWKVVLCAAHVVPFN